MAELIAMNNSGADLFNCDYDQRTALHLAASEGHPEAVKYLVERAGGDAAKLSAKDRWSGTPLGDALRAADKHKAMTGFTACVRLLQEAGAKPDNRGECNFGGGSDAAVSVTAEDTAGLVLSAASHGDVNELVHMSAQHMNLFGCDYDKRTALHLACSEGHIAAVKYLLTQLDYYITIDKVGHDTDGAKMDILTAADRFGGTPVGDALRENHQECAQLIKEAMGKLNPAPKMPESNRSSHNFLSDLDSTNNNNQVETLEPFMVSKDSASEP